MLDEKTTKPKKLSPKQSEELKAIEDRRAKVWELRKAGYSLRAIANELGVSHETIRQDMAQTMAQVHALNLAGATEYREIELARLDDIIARLYPLVFPPKHPITKIIPPPDLAAVDRYYKAVDMRAKLLGLYAPAQTQLTGANGGPVETILRIQYGDMQPFNPIGNLEPSEDESE
jgi:lambda repressor-like predicted transcriptional regulator